MDANLLIVDEYVAEVGNRCRRRGQELDDILTDYLHILQEIKEKALTEGRTSESLATFIQCVQLLRDQLTILSENADYTCERYIRDINKADSYLF